MTTLADLTEEQRDQLVGSWVKYGLSGEQFIFLGMHGITHTDAVLLNPRKGCIETMNAACFVSCPDLPRAWNPNGTPPKGRWHDGSAYQRIPEYAIIADEDEGSETQIDGDHWHDHVTTCESNQHERWGDSRRWVGEWEPVE